MMKKGKLNIKDEVFDITDCGIGIVFNIAECRKCSDVNHKANHFEYHIEWLDLSTKTSHCAFEVDNKIGYVWPASKAAKLLYSKVQKNKKGQDTNLPRRRG